MTKGKLTEQLNEFDDDLEIKMFIYDIEEPKEAEILGVFSEEKNNTVFITD